MTNPLQDSKSPCGLLNLNKPIGVTSRDVVDRVTRPLRKVKVGHAGTLDPLASGVLVVCVGAATRLIEYVQRLPKTYRGESASGATSDTLDADGTIAEAIDPPVPTEAELAVGGWRPRSARSPSSRRSSRRSRSLASGRTTWRGPVARSSSRPGR